MPAVYVYYIIYSICIKYIFHDEMVDFMRPLCIWNPRLTYFYTLIHVVVIYKYTVIHGGWKRCPKRKFTTKPTRFVRIKILGVRDLHLANPCSNIVKKKKKLKRKKSDFRRTTCAWNKLFFSDAVRVYNIWIANQSGETLMKRVWQKE